MDPNRKKSLRWPPEIPKAETILLCIGWTILSFFSGLMLALDGFEVDKTPTQALLSGLGLTGLTLLFGLVISIVPIIIYTIKRKSSSE